MRSRSRISFGLANYFGSILPLPTHQQAQGGDYCLSTAPRVVAAALLNGIVLASSRDVPRPPPPPGFFFSLQATLTSLRPPPLQRLGCLPTCINSIRSQRCQLHGCNRQVFFDEDAKQVHDFCCRRHAGLAKARGQWPPPGTQGSSTCQLPGCDQWAYRNPVTGEVGVRLG